MKYTLVFLSILLNFNILNAQISNIKWKLALDGQISLSDMEIDKYGNTYVALYYSSKLTIPFLKKKLPVAPSVQRKGYALIIKINKKGKPIWVHPFKGDFYHVIRDISIAKNGDLLITGAGDGLLYFPDKKDTLSVGKKTEGDTEILRGFYAARYSSNGKRKWVQYLNCIWGGGISIASNKQEEVYMTYQQAGPVLKNNKVIDDFPKDIASKTSIVRFDIDGKLDSISSITSNKYMYHRAGLTSIKFDNEDNMLMYGNFMNKIKFSETDSLTNEGHIPNSYPNDAIDAYVAKYNTDGKFLWATKFTGKNAQNINNIVIAKDNSIYTLGFYHQQCIVDDGIDTIQKGNYEEKYRSRFISFYCQLLSNGKVNFIRFEDKDEIGYNWIDYDQNHKIHLIGGFRDTLKVNGKYISFGNAYFNNFYSIWDNQSVEHIEKIGRPIDELIVSNFSINQGIFSFAVGNNKKEAIITTDEKTIKLNNQKPANGVYIFGGTIPDK